MRAVECYKKKISSVICMGNSRMTTRQGKSDVVKFWKFVGHLGQWPTNLGSKIESHKDILKHFSCFFSPKWSLNFGGQSRQVECQTRCPGGKIRWPWANSPMESTASVVLYRNFHTSLGMEQGLRQMAYIVILTPGEFPLDVLQQVFKFSLVLVSGLLSGVTVCEHTILCYGLFTPMTTWTITTYHMW